MLLQNRSLPTLRGSEPVVEGLFQGNGQPQNNTGHEGHLGLGTGVVFVQADRVGVLDARVERLLLGWVQDVELCDGRVWVPDRSATKETQKKNVLLCEGYSDNVVGVTIMAVCNIIDRDERKRWYSKQ